MKTIKIFWASSEELINDHDVLANLIRKLNKSYEKRGIYLELIDGDDCEVADNEKVRASDMFLALFHREFSKFVIEEFDVAKDEFKKRSFPKTYVYCKDISEGESESEELKEFKERLINEMGHYWSRYANEDSMQLQFVMQLQLVETTNQEALKVENGNIMFDGLQVAKMENLPFAALNEDFQKMHKRLAELPEKIEKKRLRVDKYPDDEEPKDELQELLNEYNALKDSFAEYQNNLFATAKRITQLQNEQITDRMRRAMDAFNEGDVRRANTILEEAERDAEIALKEYKQSKELLEQKREKVIKSIEEILLKVDTTMADLSIDIEERINKVDRLYSQVVEIAKEIEYDKEKYANVLSKYANFLDTYALYDRALKLYSEALDIQEKVLGKEHPDTATSYNNIGVVYDNQGEYDKALEYHFKALEIKEKTLGKEHPNTASSYNNIGVVYDNQGEYEKALEYHFKALEIREKTLGKGHPDTATSYNNIGMVYYNQEEYDNAL
ncbi:MAG: tetratricopeptide repeat protein, partial [Bacteroidaceae bacterium]|nr:tetratricopeptide repeat protein [Bacteroidaceae bacterium]